VTGAGGASPGPETPGWSPPGAAYAPGEPYRPLVGLSPWIFWLLVTTAAANGLSTVITLAVYGLGTYSTPAYDRLDGADIALALFGLLQGLVFLATAVLFIIWFYRAYTNLRPLGAPEPRHGVGWTIGAWFVPVLDLVLPKLMLNEIWRGSEPEPAGGAGEKATVPAFHHLWWAIWVLSFLLAVEAGVDSATSSFDSALSGDRATTTTASGALSVVGGLLSAAAAVLGALVVRRTTERQESRARKLGWTPA
jgi:hypothetical protein